MLQQRPLVSCLRAVAAPAAPWSFSFLPRAWYGTTTNASYVPPSKSDRKAARAGVVSKKAAREPEGTETILRSYKPRTPGTRHLKRPINDHLYKGRPFKPLTLPKKGQAKGGRNSSGHITVRHRGGGHKRRLRIVDFERWAPGPHSIDRIEYDPNRSAHIALVTEEATNKKSYILAADGMRAGDVVQSYRAGLPQDLLDSMGGIIDPAILAAKTAWRGNCLPLHMVPVGTNVFNVGSTRDGGGKFCRGAGTYAVVVAKEDSGKQKQAASGIVEDSTMGQFSTVDQADIDAAEEKSAKAAKGGRKGRKAAGAGPDRYVHVKLQSGEIRKVSKDACCTIGVASNVHYNKRQLGKAGRSRWLGIRPTVRGVAMNKVDHPHGGGRGKSKSNRIPTSPWGTPAKSGFKTRRKHNINKFVVTPRPRVQGRKKKETGKR